MLGKWENIDDSIWAKVKENYGYNKQILIIILIINKNNKNKDNYNNDNNNNKNNNNNNNNNDNTTTTTTTNNNVLGYNTWKKQTDSEGIRKNSCSYNQWKSGWVWRIQVIWKNLTGL